jgi:hypothetical protein
MEGQSARTQDTSWGNDDMVYCGVQAWRSFRVRLEIYLGGWSILGSRSLGTRFNALVHDQEQPIRSNCLIDITTMSFSDTRAEVRRATPHGALRVSPLSVLIVSAQCTVEEEPHMASKLLSA